MRAAVTLLFLLRCAPAVGFAARLAPRAARLRMAMSASSAASAADRVYVVGGGAVGCSILYQLAQRGVPCTLVEGTQVAAAASGKAGGFLARNWGDGGPTQALHRESFRLHREWAGELGVTSYRALPTLSVDPDGDMQGGDGRCGWLDGTGSHQLMATETDTAQISPAEYTNAVYAAAVALGAEHVTGKLVGVDTASDQGGTVSLSGLVLEDGTTLPAERVVFSMGPWTAALEDLLPEGSIKVPMTGIWSTSLVYGNVAETAQEPFALFCGEDDNGCHLEVYPRPNGEVYCCGLGGSREVNAAALRADDPSPATANDPDPRRVEAAKATLEGLASWARRESVATTQACMRPCLPDALPMLGKIASVKGAYVAAGHNCWGILWAPVTGALMAELICDKEVSVVPSIKPFSPERFMPMAGGGRGRKKGAESVGEQW